MITDRFSLAYFNDFSSSEWDSLVDHFDVTINYTSWFLNYIEILNAESRIKNFSFLVYLNDIPVSIAPLYIEYIENNWQISMGQEPVFAAVFSKSVNKLNFTHLIEYIMAEVERFVRKFNCRLARFQYSPLLNGNFSQNYYEDFGFNEDIIYPDWYIFKAKKSLVIDLNLDIADLYSAVRKSNKPHINKTRRKTENFILDKFNFDQTLFDKYIDLYLDVKGNKRSIAAFNLDAEAVKCGLEVIILCQYHDSLVGAIALHTYKKKARYNSSVQDPNISRLVYPNHFLLWEAIVYLKDHSFNKFEIGEQIIDGDNVKISNKEKNLAHFKSGWGGDSVQWLKVQKKY